MTDKKDKEMTIYEALAGLQYEIGTIQKNQAVDIGKFKFKYADLAAIREAIREPMYKWGFSLTQTMDEGKLTTCLLHRSGEMIKSSVKIPTPNDLKALGASLTYLRRYSIAAILNLVSDDDIDAGSIEASGTSLTKSDPLISKEQGKELLKIAEEYDKEEVLNKFLKGRKLVSVYQIKEEYFENVKQWLLQGAE